MTWIPYDGSGRPIAPDVKCRVKYRNLRGESLVCCAAEHCWDWDAEMPSPTEIIAYNVVGAPKTSRPSATDILRRAADLIEERGKQRDPEDGERSMGKTVAAFNAIYGTELTETQGWHFMELLKMVRSAYGEYVADDYEDKVAYAALAAESAR